MLTEFKIITPDKIRTLSVNKFSFKHAVYFLLLSSLIDAHAGSMGEIHTAHFNGLYAGLGVGESTLFAKDNYLNTINIDNFTKAELSNTLRNENTAVLFEGHLGYGKMLSPILYLGAKSSVYYTPIEILSQSTAEIPSISIGPGANYLTSLKNVNQISMQPIYNIDGILGYEIYDNFLPFVEAGVNFSSVNNFHSQNNLIQQPNFSSPALFSGNYNTHGFNTGFNVGIGANYQTHKPWLISGELVYHNLGQYSISKTYPLANVPGFLSSSSTRTFQMVSVLVSFSYLFQDQ